MRPALLVAWRRPAQAYITGFERLREEGLTKPVGNASRERKPQTFSTNDVSEFDRRGYWQHWFGSIWGTVDVESEGDLPLSGHAETAKLSDIRINRIQTTAVRTRRHPDASDSFLLVSLPQQGEMLLSNGHDQCRITPGSIYLTRHSEPEISATSGLYQTLNVQIPYALIDRNIVEAGYARHWPLARGTMASVLRHFISSLYLELPLATRRDADYFADQLCELVTRLASEDMERPQSDSYVLRSHRARVMDYLQEAASDMSLTPSKIASAAGLSVSYLHRIFATVDKSVMTEVRRVRIVKAREMLRSQRHAHLSISQVSFDCGFKSLQDFSRVFRQTAGVSPSRFRSNAIMRHAARDDAPESDHRDMR